MVANDARGKVFTLKMLTVKWGGSVISSLMEWNGCTFSTLERAIHFHEEVICKLVLKLKQDTARWGKDLGGRVSSMAKMLEI